MNSGCPLFSLLPLPAFTLSALQTARSRSRLLPSSPSLLLFIRQKKEGCCPLVFWRRERDSRLWRTRPGEQRLSAVQFAAFTRFHLVCLANRSLPLAPPSLESLSFAVHSPKKRGLLPSRFLAEREGFEPPEAFTSTVFKTAAFDRSAISPYNFCCKKLYIAICRRKYLLYAVRKLSLHTSDAIKIAIPSLRSLQDPPLRPFCTSAYIYFFRRQLL